MKVMWTDTRLSCVQAFEVDIQAHALEIGELRESV